MLTLRTSMERRHVQRGKTDVWHTFFHQDRSDLPTIGFGLLASFNEIRLPPSGVSVPHPNEEGEIVTFVYKGAVAQEDSTGGSSIVLAGEFQRMTTGGGIRYRETNASRTEWAHIFRIGLRPSEVRLDGAPEQKRFVAAERHNMLRVVASSDGRKKSLPIPQDVAIYSSLLDPGYHLIHELLPGHSAWLHIICGEATLKGLLLSQGDGVGETGEPSVSLTAREDTEILLVDLGPPPKTR